jgi:hypothetical protein
MEVTMPVSCHKSAIGEREHKGLSQVFQVPLLGADVGNNGTQLSFAPQQDGADLSLVPEGGLQLPPLVKGVKLVIRLG